MNETATYTITNKETGEVTKVALHTAGEGYSDFAPISEIGTPSWEVNPTLYRFANDMAGNLSSETYDIVLDTPEIESEK